MSWPASWLPVLADFAGEDRDEHQARLDALAEARRGGVAAIGEFEGTLGELAAAPDVVVVALLLSYRAEQAWDRFFAVVERLRPELAGHPFVRQQHAFALNRAGRGEEAERILRALREERGPSPETNGILGRVYKDRFLAAREGGDLDAAEPWLRRAIEVYLEGHDADASDPYPGLNALSLMEFAFPKPERRDALLGEVSAASRRRLLGGAPRYWDHATEWELAIHESDEQTARAAMDRAVQSLEEPWQADSTRYNTRMLSAAWASRGVTPPDWVDSEASRLDAAEPPGEPPPSSGAPPSPPSGPPSGPAGGLPDLPDFAAADRDEHREQLDALVEARAGGLEAVAEFAGTLGTLAAAPDVVVTALMLVYRAEQAWDRLFALIPRMRPELAARPFVRQQHAFALNRAGRGVDAERILLALREEHGPSPETNGILGRVYKEWFEAARAAGDEHTAGYRLQQTIDTYLEGHDADPSNPYPGLNALSVMEFTYPRPERRGSLLGEVAGASRRRLLGEGPGYWDYATEWELAVLEGDEATAGAAMERALERVEEPWQPASTGYNGRMLQAAWAARGLAAASWVASQAARLDATSPSGGPPAPSAGPPAPGGPPGGPGGPSTPQGGGGAPPAPPAGGGAPPASPAGGGAPPPPADAAGPPSVPPAAGTRPPGPGIVRRFMGFVFKTATVLLVGGGVVFGLVKYGPEKISGPITHALPPVLFEYFPGLLPEPTGGSPDEPDGPDGEPVSGEEGEVPAEPEDEGDDRQERIDPDSEAPPGEGDEPTDEAAQELEDDLGDALGGGSEDDVTDLLGPPRQVQDDPGGGGTVGTWDIPDVDGPVKVWFHPDKDTGDPVVYDVTIGDQPRAESPQDPGGGRQPAGPVVLGTGAVQITLSWSSAADLDLYVTDPEGNRFSYNNKTPAGSAGELDVDANAPCGDTMPSPVENVYWPDGEAPEGEYVVDVNLYSLCGSDLPQDYRVEVKIDGEVVESVSGTLGRAKEKQEVVRFRYPYRARGRVQILRHCDPESEVLDTFSGPGCHRVTEAGASFALLDPGTTAVLFPTEDCSGEESRSISSSFDFCQQQYATGSGINDNVRSVRIAGGSGEAEALLDRAEVESLRVFESPRDLLAQEQRVYVDRFAAESTRYVAWELKLSHPEPPTDKVPFKLAARYLDGDGAVVAEQTQDAYVAPGWTSSWHSKGWGRSSGGAFSPGSYRVEVRYGERLLAEKPFEVFAAPARVVECEETAQEGGDAPETIRVNVGNRKSVDFYYDTMDRKDRIRVSYGGEEIFDSQCVGKSDTATLQLDGSETELVIAVQPNCDQPGGTGTKWMLRVECPGP